jgi:hypothetical protein
MRKAVVGSLVVVIMVIAVPAFGGEAISQVLYADGDIGCDGTTSLDQSVGRAIIQPRDDGVRFQVVFRGAAPNHEYEITLNEMDSVGCVLEVQRNFGFVTNQNGNGVFQGFYLTEPGDYSFNINVVSHAELPDDPAHREIGTNGFVEVTVP